MSGTCRVARLCAAVLAATGLTSAANAGITVLMPDGEILVQPGEVIKVRNDAGLPDFAITDTPPLRVVSALYQDLQLPVLEDLCIVLPPDLGGVEGPDFEGLLEIDLQDDSGDRASVRVTLNQGGDGASEPICRDPAPPVAGANYPFRTSTFEEEAVLLSTADLLAVVRDPNGGFVTWDNPSVPPSAGTVTIVGTPQEPGGIEYTPAKDFNGTVNISYQVNDAHGDGPVAFTATVEVLPVNDPPSAASSACTVGVNGGPCLLTISDPDHDLSVLEVIILEQPQGGQLGDFDPSTSRISYFPSPGTTSDSFVYIVMDPNEGTSDEATVEITVTVDEQAPVAVIQLRDGNGALISNPGNIGDTDGAPGEQVVLDGSASLPGVPESAILAYRWTVNGEPLSETVASVSVALPDGQSSIELVVEDELGRESAPTTLQAVVQSRANEGSVARIFVNGQEVTTSITIDNTDFEPGETVEFDGSQSEDPDGDAIVDYAWSLNGVVVQSGPEPTATLDLADGENVVTLTVTDELGGTGSRTITVIVAADPDLGSLSGLTPAERSVGRAVSELCPRLNSMSSESMTDGQRALLNRCTNILAAGSSDQQRAALDALTPEEITSQQTTGIDFSSSQLGNLSSRLAALRGGVGGGINIAGLTLRDENGRVIPLQQLVGLAKHLITGGASGDDDVPGEGPLAGRWGIFINGNIIDGKKDKTEREAAYDFDGWGVTAGFDYRVTDQLVLGLAVGYNESDTKFAGDAGGLDSDGVSTSVYGTYFTDRLYLDFIGTSGSLDYESVRRIVYTDASGLRDDSAFGTTSGDLDALGASFGYDFNRGGWTFGPTFALTAIDVEVDPFAETGGGENGALALAFGAQRAKSRTVQGGFQAGFAWSRPWGVLSPQMRLAFVRELENDSQIVNVHFVHDPFVNDPSQPSPGAITIITDEPDRDYVRWGMGVTFVRPNGISAFVDYESLAGFSSITSHELTFGLRIERSFR